MSGFPNDVREAQVRSVEKNAFPVLRRVRTAMSVFEARADA